MESIHRNGINKNGLLRNAKRFMNQNNLEYSKLKALLNCLHYSITDLSYSYLISFNENYYQLH